MIVNKKDMKAWIASRYLLGLAYSNIISIL